MQLPAFRRGPDTAAGALEGWLYMTQHPQYTSFTPQYVDEKVAFEFLSDTEFNRLSNAGQWEYLVAWRKANHEIQLRKAAERAEVALSEAGAKLSDTNAKLSEADAALRTPPSGSRPDCSPTAASPPPRSRNN